MKTGTMTITTTTRKTRKGVKDGMKPRASVDPEGMWKVTVSERATALAAQVSAVVTTGLGIRQDDTKSPDAGPVAAGHRSDTAIAMIRGIEDMDHARIETTMAT